MSAEPTDAERAFVAEYLVKKNLADISHLRASHDRLLAAAKEALAMVSEGHSEDAWMPLEPAIAAAEEQAP